MVAFAVMAFMMTAYAAGSDLAVTGGVSAHVDPKAPALSCRITKSGGTLLHFGRRLLVGTSTGLGSKFVSVVFEVVPYNGAGKYNAAEKMGGDTFVEVTLHTEGMPGIEEKWLASSGTLIVANASAAAVSGTVDAELTPTRKKAGPIHLSGSWSCPVEK